MEDPYIFCEECAMSIQILGDQLNIALSGMICPNCLDNIGHIDLEKMTGTSFEEQMKKVILQEKESHILSQEEEIRNLKFALREVLKRIQKGIRENFSYTQSFDEAFLCTLRQALRGVAVAPSLRNKKEEK